MTETTYVRWSKPAQGDKRHPNPAKCPMVRRYPNAYVEVPARLVTYLPVCGRCPE